MKILEPSAVRASTRTVYEFDWRPSRKQLQIVSLFGSEVMAFKLALGSGSARGIFRQEQEPSQVDFVRRCHQQHPDTQQNRNRFGFSYEKALASLVPQRLS
jgi:hypothetical protein